MNSLFILTKCLLAGLDHPNGVQYPPLRNSRSLWGPGSRLSMWHSIDMRLLEVAFPKARCNEHFGNGSGRRCNYETSQQMGEGMENFGNRVIYRMCRGKGRYNWWVWHMRIGDVDDTRRFRKDDVSHLERIHQDSRYVTFHRCAAEELHRRLVAEARMFHLAGEVILDIVCEGRIDKISIQNIDALKISDHTTSSPMQRMVLSKSLITPVVTFANDIWRRFMKKAV